MKRWVTWIVAWGVMTSAAQAHALVLGPDGAPAPRVTQWRAVAAWDGAREVLMMTPAVELDVPSARLVWVLPLPADAAARGGDEDALRDAARISHTTREPAQGEKTKKTLRREEVGPAQPPLADHRREVVMMPGAGEEAAEALGVWLKERGVSQPPAGALDYYAARGWRLAAVEVVAEGDTKITGGLLPPVVATFEAARLFVPLLHTRGDRGEPALRVTLLTARRLTQAELGEAAGRGIEVAGVVGYPYLGPRPGEPLESGVMALSFGQLPSTLRGMLERAGWGRDATAHVRTLYAERMGRADDALGPLRWIEDLAMPAGEGQLVASAPASVAEASPKAPEAPAPAADAPAATSGASTSAAEAPRAGCSASASGVGAWWAALLAVAAGVGRRRRLKRS